MRVQIPFPFRQILILFVLFFEVKSLHAQVDMELINRGVVAVRTSSSQVYIGWRMLGNDPANVAFNVYRGTTKLNASPITGSTNYIDNTSTNATYAVRAVVGGVEQAASAMSSVWLQNYLNLSLQRPPGGTTPDGVAYTYSPNDCSVGDLDGDGEYEIVVKWDPSNSKDNSQSGYTGNTFLDAYEYNGSRLWRIDLGRNIRSGAHYTQFLVYDFDSNGSAEVVCKTADGTIDGQGTVIGNASADYRNSGGYILTGPEFLTVFAGNNGRALATANYVPARGTVSSWGDNYGNRVDRFLAGVAYLDGNRPSILMCRGYYTRSVIAAWDFRNGSLTQRWVFDTNNGYASYTGQGAHSLSIGDADNDGRDEIMYGAMAINDNGTPMYNTTFNHGDATHLGDFLPNRAGLEFFMPSESAGNTSDGIANPGVHLRDAGTGQIIWSKAATGDIGRALTADITAAYPGNEFWAAGGLGIYDSQGNQIPGSIPSINFAVWWDADPLRELLNGNTISKFGTGNLLVASGALSNNGTKSTPSLTADLFGDWREEVILRGEDNQSLRIYTTTELTSRRIYTLMHNPQYRVAVAWQNVGYNQPPHPSFFIGDGMATPPQPNIRIVGGPATINLNGAIQGSQIDLTWTVANVAVSGQEIYRDTDPDPEGRIRIATPSASTRSYTDNTAQTGITYYYWLKVNGTYNSNAVAATLQGSTALQIQEATSNVAGFCGVDGTIDSNNAGFTGTGFANTTNTIGAGVVWRVNVPATGTYALQWRYANGGASDRPGRVLINGSPAIASVSLPATGAWTTWATSTSVSVTLTTGTNTIRLESTTADGIANIDWISINGTGLLAASCNTSARIQESSSGSDTPMLELFPNPSAGNATLRFFFPRQARASIHIRNQLGQLLQSYAEETYLQGTHQLELKFKTLSAGVYTVQVRSAEQTYAVKMIIQ